MVFSTGGVPEDTEDAAPGPAGTAGTVRTAGAVRTRRDLAHGLRVTALAAALAGVVAAAPPSRTRTRPAPGRPPGGTDFSQTYRGRRIRGVWTPERGSAGRGRWHVTVDGRPLHLMRRADGTWLSTVDHYCSYPTPLDAARAAVDELGPGERLRAAAATEPGEEHPHRGGRHGVRA
ncbi:tyrosinase family oxidase copper chaperone [Streptomyces sp. JHA26]|uniref:tyrosinase family oxidase copper chaperone n=1 Tax=Streptomyces sp. JHA26 TaxID=1917143 RepID=UPI00098B0393|nr:tyrosinase family oxidase copper chaperone [Streptomyces sp. JHA26]